ncbi:FGGY family carbohydrate kinase, partial [Bacteroides caccae]|uniref:FGGY family carbohydrate kinase n=1 Tax=Bacteroides caccae TaxID=47678 RepID=UPI0021D40FFD
MDWASEIGDVIGVDLDSVMPPLKLVNEIIGFVTDEAADATGLVSGIPVIAGSSPWRTWMPWHRNIRLS